MFDYYNSSWEGKKIHKPACERGYHGVVAAAAVKFL